MRNLVLTALAVAFSLPAHALPELLINCASGQYRGHLATIVVDNVAAGVVMPSMTVARARAEGVVHSNDISMIAADDQTAVVRVTKLLEIVGDHDSACVIFTGVLDNQPVPPPGTWTSRVQKKKGDTDVAPKSRKPARN